MWNRFAGLLAPGIVAFMVAYGAYSDTYTVKVTGIIDGDTFVAMHDGKPETIHLLGVDAPEPAQPFAAESKNHLSNLIMGKEVTVNPVGTDKDKNIVATVVLGDGTDLGHRLVGDGTAWDNESENTGDTEMRGLAAKAIAGKKGLWALPTPLAPWDFRGDKPKVDIGATEKPSAAQKPESEKTETQTVYIADNSKEYHKEGCALLDKTKRPIPLKDAEARKYTPCKICFPPKTANAPVVSAKGNYADVPRTFFPQYKDNPIYQQAQPSWYTDANGNVTGITAKNISSLPFASLLGFQDGDVIQSINGETIDSEQKIEQLVGRLKDAKSVSVGIIRNGTPQTITVQIPALPF